jgi:hypothetical protein
MAAVEAMPGKDATMNAYINAFLKWLVHDTDELPERPPKPTPGRSRPSRS